MNGITAKQREVLKTLAAWADQFPCIRGVYVFGSFARGVEMPDDIDIAIDYSELGNRVAVACYSAVNASSEDLEHSLSKIVPVHVAWTGLAVLSEGYDQTAWAAIQSGRVVQCCGKAQMIWTDPKPSQPRST